MSPSWLSTVRTRSWSSTSPVEGIISYQKRTKSLPVALLCSAPSVAEQLAHVPYTLPLTSSCKGLARRPQSQGKDNDKQQHTELLSGAIAKPASKRNHGKNLRQEADAEVPPPQGCISEHEEEVLEKESEAKTEGKEFADVRKEEADEEEEAPQGREDSQSFQRILSSKVSLMALEEELSRPVPDLLDAMNRASSEVNVLERQLSQAQARHRQLLERWGHRQEQLRAEHGVTFDRVRPYFEAAQAFHSASKQVQASAGEFSAATSRHEDAKAELSKIERSLDYGAHHVSLDCEQQDGLSRATVRVLVRQQERDRREREYAQALHDYTEAQEAVEALKVQIGETVIRRLTPSFQELRSQQAELAAVQSQVDELSAKLGVEKATYGSCLCELERINTDMHDARKAYEDAIGCCSSLILSSEASTTWQDSRGLDAKFAEVFGDDLLTGSDSWSSSLSIGVAKKSSLGAQASPSVAASRVMPSFQEEDDGPFA